MRKGVSPVVATVLLIAIAVISSVAVWYWVAPFTAAQPMPSTSQKGYIVADTYPNASNTGCNGLDLRNTGGQTISGVVFEIRDYATGKQAGINGTNPVIPAYINMTYDLTPGNTNFYNISQLNNASNRTSVPFGTYILRPSATYSSSVAGLADQLLTCTAG